MGKKKISESEKWFVNQAIKSQKQEEVKVELEPSQEEPSQTQPSEKLNMNDPILKDFIKDWQRKNFGSVI